MEEDPKQRLAKYIENARRFSYEHSNAVEGMFLSAYSIEQALLVVLTYVYQAHIGIIISLFVITAFFTFGLQKLIIEAKNKYLEKRVMGLTKINEQLIDYIGKLEQEKDSVLKNTSPKGLNKTKANKTTGEKND